MINLKIEKKKKIKVKDQLINCSYELQGKCSDLLFQVSFVVDELNYKVLQLRVKVSFHVKRDLRQFIN